jgi:hypothetical protein
MSSANSQTFDASGRVYTRVMVTVGFRDAIHQRERGYRGIIVDGFIAGC